MVIGPFKGEFGFLSNMFIAPFLIDGVRYSSVENYYQSNKCYNEVDRVRLRECSPYYAKKEVRMVLLFDNWVEMREHFMARGIFAKFSQNRNLNKLLKNTGDAKLVELNYWHDNFWGDCTCKKCRNVKGMNKLGRMLMDVRLSI